MRNMASGSGYVGQTNWSNRSNFSVILYYNVGLVLLKVKLLFGTPFSNLQAYNSAGPYNIEINAGP